jgi:spore maturation protein SpmA
VNAVFFAIVTTAFCIAALRETLLPGATGEGPSPMSALTTAVIDQAGGAVDLAIGLVGVMTLFLGLMKVAEAGGLLVILARVVRPLMHRLFPDVPADHPAMGSMILNISANVLGLGNAATPFGIRAIQQLESLNPTPGTATNAMILFLAINTSSVTLLPTGVIGLRAAAGSADPAAIVPTTLFATLCSTTVAILMAKLCARFWPVGTVGDAPAGDRPTAAAEPAPPAAPEAGVVDAGAKPYPLWGSLAFLGTVLAVIPLSVVYGRVAAPWIIPVLVTGLLAFGVWRRVRVYEVLVDGAREGFQVAVRIIPYLVAILVAVGMFRASGAIDLLIRPLGTITAPLGLPPEAVPMALLRPLSGTGAFGVLASLLNDPAIGPDSYTGYLVSTIQGSTDTTFYILAVYFGAVGVRRIRHALVAGLTADAAGIAASVFICSQLYGG